MSASVSSLPLQERALRALRSLPPLSPILHRVIASLAHEDVSFAKVAELIEIDIVLTGNILQLVNSPLYSTRGSVSSVRHAISILGVNKLRNAVLGVSASQLWGSSKTPPDWSMRGFNQHSVSVAILADLLSQHLPAEHAAGAFVAGLFHDLGLLLIAVGLPMQYKQISMSCQTEPGGAAEHELEVLGMTHADLSAEALGVWNLPSPIRTAVRYHMRPELEPTHGSAIALSRIVHAADGYVSAMNPQFCKLEGAVPGSEALDCLGLGEQVTGVLREFENELMAIQPYF